MKMFRFTWTDSENRRNAYWVSADNEPSGYALAELHVSSATPGAKIESFWEVNPETGVKINRCSHGCSND